MSRDTGSHTEDVLKYFHPTPLHPLHPADANLICGCTGLSSRADTPNMLLKLPPLRNSKLAVTQGTVACVHRALIKVTRGREAECRTHVRSRAAQQECKI